MQSRKSHYVHYGCFHLVYWCVWQARRLALGQNRWSRSSEQRSSYIRRSIHGQSQDVDKMNISKQFAKGESTS